jgi:hypothetical protein
VVIEPDSAMDGIMGTAAKHPPDAVCRSHLVAAPSAESGDRSVR